MAQNMIIESAALINLRVTSSLNDFMAEKRFDRGLTVLDFKTRLELITGASAGTMTISIYDDQDELQFVIDNNDNALLGSLCIEENYRIHVTDVTKAHGEFEDLSKVEKFELSEQTYDQRNDSVRSFLRRNKLGKYNAEEMATLQQQEDEAKAAEEKKAASIKLGDRCEVTMIGEATRRGTVMYIGKTEFKEGVWVGLKYDEPVGKNDGSVQGKRYFDAPMKYGGFTRPCNVTVGDYPEMDYDDEEM